MKTFLGIIAGFLLWTVLWLVGNAVLNGMGMIPAQPEQEVAAEALAALLGLSVVASVAAGFVSRVVAPHGRGPLILGVLLLATGAAVQITAWKLFPLWYHVSFLGLLVPLTLFGAKAQTSHTPPPPEED